MKFISRKERDVVVFDLIGGIEGGPDSYEIKGTVTEMIEKGLPGAGNIILFDNSLFPRHRTHTGQTFIIEMNPVTQEIVWKYETDSPRSFFSKERGSNQRLENGNTLICESGRGRAFEVDPSGEIVWEFWNPEMRGTQRRRIYRTMRLSPALVEPLLSAGKSASPE